MKTLLFSLFLVVTVSIVAQVEIDKKIELTGAGSDAKIEGIQVVEEDYDAANKKYVDDQITSVSSSAGHVVGELYGGGVVYAVYKDANGNEHGLIVDLTDKSAGRSWSATTSGAVPGGATSFWNGFANSEAIKAQNNNSAGADCRNSTNGGYSDWYLPARHELNTLWNAYFYVRQTLSTASGAVLLSGANYWSSSEFSNPVASWRQNFDDGIISNPDKSTSLRVRCVRAF